MQWYRVFGRSSLQATSDAGWNTLKILMQRRTGSVVNGLAALGRTQEAEAFATGQLLSIATDCHNQVGSIVTVQVKVT